MNDRIKELAEQAQKEVWGNNPYNGSPEFEGYELDTEKFAELIVKECANIASCDWHITLPTDTGGTYHPLTIVGGQTAKNIMDHFGVKVNTGQE